MWSKAVPLLILAGLLVYANCVTKTLVFDDDAWLVDIASLDDPPQYMKDMQGRPLLAITNLIVHRMGRNNPVGHHVLNIFIHLAATLTLYGIVRRSLLRPRFGDRFAGRAPYLSFAAALLWMVHPLQVQCVTYIIQRGESMAGLFYMFTMYAMLRADESTDAEAYSWRRFGWYALAIFSVVLSYASKEITASIPGAVILFDRIFLARSWRQLIRRRWIFYIAFFLVWGAFTAWHLMRAKESEGGIGFGMEAVTPKKYALTQLGVILYYLQISVWPRGLAIDYQGWPWTETLSDALPELAIVGAMLLATAILLFWRPALGFVCAWFFIALAPTSSVLPIVDAVFEHRMYLSLATIAVLVVFLGDWLLRTVRLGILRPVALGILAAALGVLTFLRNEDYRSRHHVWEIAVERMPNSVRARSNYAQGLLIVGKAEKVVPILQRALEIAPYDRTSLINLAAAYEQLGHFEGATECYARLSSAYPTDWKYSRMYASSLLLLGRWEEAEAAYRETIARNRAAAENSKEALSAEPHYGRAAALFAMGRLVSADVEARNATDIDPNWPESVLALARLTILDERLHWYRDARRSAQTWAGLGLQYIESPQPIDRDTMALSFAANGEFEKAAAQARASLEEEPLGPWGAAHRDRLRYYERNEVPWPK